MSGDRGDAQNHGGFPPQGCTINHGDDGDMRGRRIVGVTLNIGGNGSRGDPPHRCVHQKTAGNHSRKGGLLPHI